MDQITRGDEQLFLGRRKAPEVPRSLSHELVGEIEE